MPRALGRRFGQVDFWWRWTAAEAVAKAIDLPILTFVGRFGLPQLDQHTQAPSVEIDGTRWGLQHTVIGDDIVACTTHVEFPESNLGQV